MSLLPTYRYVDQTSVVTVRFLSSTLALVKERTVNDGIERMSLAAVSNGVFRAPTGGVMTFEGHEDKTWTFVEEESGYNNVLDVPHLSTGYPF